jgi:hypothetical protein
MKFSLVIKAESCEQALEVAKRQGCTLTGTVTKHADYDEVYATTGDIPVEVLQKWHSNPLMNAVVDPIDFNGPFPYGTLLFFSVAQEDA